ncbi:MAG TPA: RDD family protein [Mucilaginibacter sp.]|nr:RDD family protein [Mucilaginibacter sp.]
MQTIRITTPQNIDIDYEVAGLGERIVARLIDMALFVIVFLAGIIITASTASSGSGITLTILLIVFAALFVFYDIICELMMNGQSLGKRIMKIKVISLNGARPSFGQYLLRWLFRIVDFTLTFQGGALICAAVSEKTQRIGDIVAGTTLIKTHPRTQFDQVSFAPVIENYTPVFMEVSQLSDKDIALIHEVINNYYKTGNGHVVYNAARRTAEILAITKPPGMDDLRFLQTIVKDYSHQVVNTQVNPL